MFVYNVRTHETLCTKCPTQPTEWQLNNAFKVSIFFSSKWHLVLYTHNRPNNDILVE